MANRSFHLHLVSDATGDTLYALARACVSQFAGVTAEEHSWTMIRSVTQLDAVMAGIEAKPGMVLFTLVDPTLRSALMDRCRQSQTPCIPVLDPVLGGLSAYLGIAVKGQPGRQHVLDQGYFDRIEAMQFSLAHDDGQGIWNLEQADVVLVGVSRTSKTPTCVYLANRGYRAGNVPLVPNVSLPDGLENLKRPLVIGLTKDPNRLVQIRRNRVLMLNQDPNTDYTDPETVRKEVAWARQIYEKNKWPVIDVTRRSIEETAATVIQLLENRDRDG